MICPLFYLSILSFLLFTSEISVQLNTFFSLSFCSLYVIPFPLFYLILTSPLRFPISLPFWPPRESSERAWGSLKCGSTSWREMQRRLRRLRVVLLNSTRLVCVCLGVWVCAQFKLGTLSTDAPIISLISGITLWRSDGSRHIFGLFHQASGYIPYSAACVIFFAQVVEVKLKESIYKQLDNNRWRCDLEKTLILIYYVVFFCWELLIFFVFAVVQECACPVGDEEEAGGGSFAVYSERRDVDCGSGFGQTGLGKGFQQGKRNRQQSCHDDSL